MKHKIFQKHVRRVAIVYLIILIPISIYNFYVDGLEKGLFYLLWVFFVVFLVFVGLDVARDMDKKAKELSERYLETGEESDYDKLNEFYETRRKKKIWGPFWRYRMKK